MEADDIERYLAELGAELKIEVSKSQFVSS
jgi:hypothetical protein